MAEPLPLLPTSVIGSYAWPGWLHLALEAAQQGRLGSQDFEDIQDDAVDLAVRDQFVLFRRGPKTPDQLAIRCVQTVDASVVGAQ